MVKMDSSVFYAGLDSRYGQDGTGALKKPSSPLESRDFPHLEPLNLRLFTWSSKMKTAFLCLAFFHCLSSCLAATYSADNCARAVTGTANGLAAQSSHRQDCSSFFDTVVGTVITQTVVASTASETTTDATLTLTAATITDVELITVTTLISTTTVSAVVVSESPPADTLQLRDGFEQPTAIATATPVVTSTAVVDITTTLIASVMLTDLITATTVLTDDVTATSTDAVTATTVSVPLPAPCGEVTPGGGSCGCDYTIQSGV
ncbi:hypothetical protein MMC15_008145 [Xylographa vitiligo]|nr:hypothetical protein [Xylographa vitiligo]